MITLWGSWKDSVGHTARCYPKNNSLTFYTHPVLGGCQNKFTVGSSPDLPLLEGLASVTMNIDGSLAIITADMIAEQMVTRLKGAEGYKVLLKV